MERIKKKKVPDMKHSVHSHHFYGLGTVVSMSWPKGTEGKARLGKARQGKAKQGKTRLKGIGEYFLFYVYLHNSDRYFF